MLLSIKKYGLGYKRLRKGNKICEGYMFAQHHQQPFLKEGSSTEKKNVRNWYI